MKNFIETFDDYSKKYQKLQEIETPYDDIDINKPYGVVSYGGSIGSHKKGYFNKKNGKLIATFDDEKEAKEKAKRMNSVLSKGEKSYYGMRYSAVKIKPKDFELNELGEYIFKEELYENNLGAIRDDLKANFRKFEIDADNKKDTEDLFRKLQKKYKKVDSEELWQLAKDWTGYEEDLDEKLAWTKYLKELGIDSKKFKKEQPDEYEYFKENYLKSSEASDFEQNYYDDLLRITGELTESLDKNGRIKKV